MKNFKKIGTAVAVTSALGVAGTAHSITLGEPGEALLVPYALCDTANGVNTLVGITVPATIHDDPTSVYNGLESNTGNSPDGFSTTQNTDYDQSVSGYLTTTGDDIHWYFFDTTSVHQLDNGMPASKNDFVPFDWCANLEESGKTVLDGQIGYLVFGNEGARGNSNTDSFAMFGDAAVVEGNWQSAAYIPVVPLADDDDSSISACDDEVIYSSNIPSAVNPLCAGMALDNGDGDNDDTAWFNMRYFLDPALNGGTDLVVWTDRNCRGGSSGDGCNRKAVAIEVYDTEETSGSDAMDLSLELNVIDASTLAWTTHVDNGPYGSGEVNSGHVEIVLQEVAEGTVAASEPSSSAVAFSLIRFGTAANARQVQTALAQERGHYETNN